MPAATPIASEPGGQRSVIVHASAGIALATQARMRANRWFVFLLFTNACGLFGGGQGDGGDVDTGGVEESTGDVLSTGCPALDGANGSGTVWDGTKNYLEPQVMTAAGSPHTVSGSLSFWDIDLEIEPCALVLLESSAGIDVAGTGRLIALGREDAPIVLDAVDPSAPWGNLSTGGVVGVYGGFLDLAHVELRNGGGDASYPGVLYLGNDELADAPGEVARVQQVTIAGSRSHGVMMFDGAAFTDDSADLRIEDAADVPIVSDFLLAGSIPPGSYADNPNAIIELVNGYFAQPHELVLHDHGLPYRLGNDDDAFSHFSIDWGNADDGSASTLVLAPGVELRFYESAGLTIYEGGVLDARGSADAPIVLTSASASPASGDWMGVLFDGPVADDTALDQLEIAYAGADVLLPMWAHCVASDVDDHTEAAALTFSHEPAPETVGTASIHHSAAHGINRAWTGDAIDLAASVTFEAIAGCPQTLPIPEGGACPQDAACGG